MIQSEIYEFLHSNKPKLESIFLLANKKECEEAAQVAELLGFAAFVLPEFSANFGESLRAYGDELSEIFANLAKFYSYNTKTTKQNKNSTHSIKSASQNLIESKTPISEISVPKIPAAPDSDSINSDSIKQDSIESNHKNHKKIPLLFAPTQTLLVKMPKAEYLQSFCIKTSEKINLNEFKEKMYNFGYEFVDLVELAGEISIRGEIIDIFAPNLKKPVRICFFDDEIESIRHFEPQTQLAEAKELEKIELSPALFALNSQEYENLKEKIESSEIFQNELNQNAPIASFGLWFLENTEFLPLCFSSFISKSALEKLAEIESFQSPNTQDFSDLDSIKSAKIELSKTIQAFKNLPKIQEAKEFSDIEISQNNLASFLEFHKEKSLYLIAANSAQLKAANLNELAKIYENEEKNEINFTQNSQEIHLLKSRICVNIASKKMLILSLNSLAYKNKPKAKKARILLDELQSGDYIVHDDYGVGVFSALVQASVFGAVRDFVELKYAGEDKLLLPVENLNKIERFICDGSVPQVDRLGRGSFAKIKEKVRAKLFVIASEIIKLAAQRELINGHKIDTQSPELAIFSASSGFEYTQDQKTAIFEIFKDISSAKVMDRLLCGDVGFGKTEVALNAMYAAHLSGLQSALIVPTTLLSFQHFQTLKERLEPHGVAIARLDRYCSTKEKNTILNGLKNGEISAIVGTHALLNAEFSALGLIVVDEEHKFGVKQKEKIKEISSNTHFLSMSATPIPRTLNMALSKIKGCSKLDTPPIERSAVRSFVKEKSDSLLKEAILRELRRGGQIFYIHNNIATINSRKTALNELLADLKIAILHSQIESSKAEQIMLDFAQKKYDLLLCTSIVESGIHLPNANTILIESADRFGIADLHQLRGRVGRGAREGFCYFLIEDSSKITEEAAKRLNALEKNSFLGSGSALAYQDLEIRGGGNLLGSEQSGHIKNIGYGLYLRLLEDEIYKLSGEISQTQKNIEVKLTITAFISADLVESERLRLELYRRLSHCENEQELYAIESEISERFGKIDTYTKQFLELILIKILAQNAGFININNYKQNINLTNKNNEKTTIVAKTSDEDDILEATLDFLRKKCDNAKY